jgi:hypothetical protein
VARGTLTEGFGDEGGRKLLGKGEAQVSRDSGLEAEDFQRELSFLGIENSHALVMEPEGKGCAEVEDPQSAGGFTGVPALFLAYPPKASGRTFPG